MKAAYPILLWLFAIVGLAFGAEPQAEKKESFAAQVDAMLRSPWTEIHITQAVMTDYGEIHGVTIELSREAKDGPVFYRPDDKAAKKQMPDEQFKKLLETVIAAAKEVEEVQTPAEIFSSVSKEEAAQLIREGKLRLGWDVVELVICCTNPSAKKPLSNGGLSRKFTDFLKQEFSFDKREISREESKRALGGDPYKDLF